MVAGKKWERDQKTLKRLNSAINRLKMDYGFQMYSKASPDTLKKFKECIRIYTGIFKILPVGSLHIEAYNLPVELRRNSLCVLPTLPIISLMRLS